MGVVWMEIWDCDDEVGGVNVMAAFRARRSSSNESMEVSNEV